MGIKEQLQQRLREKILIYDGAMGTSIQQRELPIEAYGGFPGCYDHLNCSSPDVISSIHASFFEAGADIIETNTFGAQPLTLAEHGLADKTYEINKAGAACAVAVAVRFGKPGIDRFVAGSMGPGLALPSLGHVSFTELAEGYYTQALGLLDGGVHLFQIETCQDSLQIKAALFGVFRAQKERGCELPVVVTVTIQPNGALLAGTDMEALAAILNPYPLFAVGLNCSAGPSGLAGALDILRQYSRFPIAVLANAGLPVIRVDKIVYDMTPEMFAHETASLISPEVHFVGGCCGTTPLHIKALAQQLSGVVPDLTARNHTPMIASLFSAQTVDTLPKPLLISERANASGSKAFRTLVQNSDYDAMISFINDETTQGAHAVDVSVAVPGRNEIEDMDALMSRLVMATTAPLMIDSTDPDVIETALRHIGGRAVINSVNLEDEQKARALLLLAYSYGAAIVCLTIDEQGMAQTAERKTAIAKRLYDIAVHEIGLLPDALWFDPLTFTVATGEATSANAAVETLAAIGAIKKACPGVKISLGVSNVSYGLDRSLRRILNAVFLFHAVREGLDVAIADSSKLLPLSSIEPDVLDLAEDVVFNRSVDALHRFLQKTTSVCAEETHEEIVEPLEQVYRSILAGKVDRIVSDVQSAARKKPSEVVDAILSAMQEVGVRFEAGTMQLPFVLRSAETVQKAFELLKPLLAESTTVRNPKKILLATVKGDIHDIGKNLVGIILENNGYEVIDIGVDKKAEEIADAVAVYTPDAVGLSGLLVRSAHAMKDVCRLFSQRRFTIPLLCGGAALSVEFVHSELVKIYPKTLYAKDAFEAIRCLSEDTCTPHHVPRESTHVPGQGYPEVVAAAKIPTLPWVGAETLSLSIDEITGFINTKLLYETRWRYTGCDDTGICRNIYNEMLDFVRKEHPLTIRIRYGYFRAYAGKNGIIVTDAESRQAQLTVATGVSGASLSHFVADNDSIALYAVGVDGVQHAQKLHSDKKYHDYFLWHGFCAECAEAGARAITARIRHELAIGERGARYSFGYPACPDIANHAVLDSFLDFREAGIALSDSYMLSPDTATAGFFLHHPQACYFTP